ncbi:hypothetical protein N9042_00480 [bacterium]|nr:hypothetical protein [Akkermansiaceae bacterium]MDB4488223.1 hypothetical protein [bacterium]MDB4541899.1 hypothetical protein [bacterium]
MKTNRRSFLMLGCAAAASAVVVSGVAPSGGFGCLSSGLGRHFRNSLTVVGKRLCGGSHLVFDCELHDAVAFQEQIGEFADAGTPIIAQGNELVLTRDGQQFTIKLKVKPSAVAV